jgi:hypothetical protein
MYPKIELTRRRDTVPSIEGIFSPIERVWRGVGWDEIFARLLRRRTRGT